jgi:hypothetical protein
MNEEKIKEFIFQAVQSGKQETSGLVDLIIHKMESKLDVGIQKGIETHVNGKIKNIDRKIDDYIKSDNEWKSKYSPYLEGIVGVSVGGKILIKLVLGIAAVGGAILVIYHWFK